MNTEEVCGARAGKDLRVDTCAKTIYEMVNTCERTQL